MVCATRWWIWTCWAALTVTACGETGSGSATTLHASAPGTATTDVAVSAAGAESTADVALTDDDGSSRSFFLADADPAVVPVVRLPSDSGDVEARVGPLPDGGQGVCAVDAFGTFPQQVACFEPGADGRLFVPLESEGQPIVFIDDRVTRVTLRSDVDPERDLQLFDVPGVPGARITQGTTEVDPDLDATIAFYDQSGVELIAAAYQPPRL